MGRIDLGVLVNVGAGGQQAVIRILDIVDQAVLLAVEPDVADHAVRRRNRAGGEGRVADDGLGIGVLVMGVGVINSLLHQVTETTLAQYMRITPGQIRA